MTSPSVIGLATGLRVFILAGIAICASLVWYASSPVPPNPSGMSGVSLPEDATLYPRQATRAYAAQLRRHSADSETTLRCTLASLHAQGAGEEDRRLLVLQSALASLRGAAPNLRWVSVAGYDDILDGFAEGLRRMETSGSRWCKGPAIAALTRQNDSRLIDTVLIELARHDAAYDWALNWTKTVLTHAQEARFHPVRHGRRTGSDETVVQDQGRQLGIERWPVALSVAGFSLAEGRNYAAMRDAVAAIDICQLGQAAEALSDRVPAAIRGRVMAELLPEIFYGNTPYVFYLLQGYFFIG